MSYFKIISVDDDTITPTKTFQFDLGPQNLMTFSNLKHILKHIDEGDILCQVVPEKDCNIIYESDGVYGCQKGKLIKPRKLTTDFIYDMILHGADVHIGNDLPLVKAVEIGNYNLFSFFQNACGADVTVHNNYCLQVCYQNLLKNKNLGNLDLLNMTIDILRWTNKKTNQFVEHLSVLVKAKKMDAIEARQVIIDFCRDELELPFVAGEVSLNETMNPIYENINYENIDDIKDKINDDDLEPYFETDFQEESIMDMY